MKEIPRDENTQAPKRPSYQAPEVVRVSLRPEEAVLGHCKTSTSTGPATHGSCRSLFCRTMGS